MSTRRATKRRRHNPTDAPVHRHHQSFASTSNEERLLHQAIQNSKLGAIKAKTTTSPTNTAPHRIIDVPWGPTFFPTVQDMQGSPLDYIDKIRPIAQRYGICKIVPPEGWKQTDFFAAEMEVPGKFSTKQQLLHRIQEGISFGDGEECNPGSYQRYASAFTKEYKRRNYPDENHPGMHKNSDEQCHRKFTPENLEQDYWDIVENRSRHVTVDYGNDVDSNEFGSGFPLSERGRSVSERATVDPSKVNLPEPEFGTQDYYKETWWNLNNIPWTPDSVLRHVKVGINGINVPWMYYGSLFTTFCWHNEDNYLYSINYHHKGAPKQWYGVPGTKKDADGLEKVFKSYLSMKMRDVPDLLHHITTQFSPRLLQNAQIPIYKLLQHEGEFVVTFPRAFHGGFSMGPNIGEAVNFATHDWIAHGSDANERYRSFARPAVFSHDRLTFTMAHHVSEQKSYKNCKLLLNELERVVSEEMQLRRKLLNQGVRDVTEVIQLPPNRLDQLDEDSADYDDKRLCHACKHVCFFSAVACECSQSKVSCLRHSHYMCRCPVERRYLMIWSPEEELNSTCQAVRDHCETLKPEGYVEIGEGTEEMAEVEPLPEIAPGVEKDLELHKIDVITTDPYIPPSKIQQQKNPSFAAEVTTDEDHEENERDEGDDNDEDKGDDGDDSNDEDYVEEEEERQEVVILDSSDEEDGKKKEEDSDDEVEVVGVIKGNL